MLLLLYIKTKKRGKKLRENEEIFDDSVRFFDNRSGGLY